MGGIGKEEGERFAHPLPLRDPSLLDGKTGKIRVRPLYRQPSWLVLCRPESTFRLHHLLFPFGDLSRILAEAVKEDDGPESPAHDTVPTEEDAIHVVELLKIILPRTAGSSLPSLFSLFSLCAFPCVAVDMISAERPPWFLMCDSQTMLTEQVT
jgi:hypothetical protein